MPQLVVFFSKQIPIRLTSSIFDALFFRNNTAISLRSPGARSWVAEKKENKVAWSGQIWIKHN